MRLKTFGYFLGESSSIEDAKSCFQLMEDEYNMDLTAEPTDKWNIVKFSYLNYTSEFPYKQFIVDLKKCLKKYFFITGLKIQEMSVTICITIPNGNTYRRGVDLGNLEINELDVSIDKNINEMIQNIPESAIDSIINISNPYVVFSGNIKGSYK